jgi:hypothetical protein
VRSQNLKGRKATSPTGTTTDHSFHGFLTDRAASIILATIVCLTVAAVIAIRIRLLGIPLERDEGEYAYTGQLMLQGIPPYKLAYSMKFPGTATAYAVIMSIFGQTIIGIHLGLLLVTAATAILTFFLGRRLLNSTAGAAAAATYAVLSINPKMLGLASHATHFVMLPVLAGLLLLLKVSNRGALVRIFASGLLFGVGVLMKQPAIYFILFGAVYLIFRDLRDSLGLRQICVRNLTFIAAALFPIGLTCLLLWSAHVSDKFWFWTIDYARQYAAEGSLSKAAHNFIASLPDVIRWNWTLWVLAGVGLCVGVCNQRTRATTGFLLSLLAFSFLAVASGFQFRNHYFILLLPAASLLAGVGVSSACDLAGRYPGWVRLIPLLLFFGALAWPVYEARSIFFQLSPTEVCQTIYSGNPFVEAISVAKYIRERTTLADRIAVLGSEPEIYFYAKRQSATGYIYTYGLVEGQPFASQMQQEMIREIETASPKYFVVIGIGSSWLSQPGSDHPVFDWITNYTRQNYDLVGFVNMVGPKRTDYYFDDLPKSVSWGGSSVIFVDRRKL